VVDVAADVAMKQDVIFSQSGVFEPTYLSVVP
jgi:hypothetical protein